MDQEFVVNKALDLYGHGKVSREYLLRQYDPVVVHLPDKTCVAMKSRKPTVDGEDVMCFDKSEERLLFTYSPGIRYAVD